MKMPDDPEEARSLFAAEAAYAESIFREGLGDLEASIAALKRALEIKPDYAPAALTLGSIEYQLGNEEEGARLFRSLVIIPDNDGELWEIVDTAGDFLIQTKRYAEGLELYEAATRRFPERATLYQGVGCCAAHEGLLDKALEASRKALELEPDRQDLTNDLGWSLLQAGQLEEAEKVLLRAMALDPSDELARENLRRCQAARGEEP